MSLRPAFLLALLASLAAPAGAAELPYKTVAEARAALSAKDSAVCTQADGWLTITEPLEGAQWSFVPADHPAHPAVVRRSVLRPAGAPAQVVMSTLCEAPAPACEALRQEFEAQNSRFEQYVRSRQRRPVPPSAAP